MSASVVFPSTSNERIAMTSRTVITTIALSAACAVFSVAAQQRDAMKACQADVKTYCANVERGDGRLAKCLKENEDKVSAECKARPGGCCGLGAVELSGACA
jgi:hypothetical protein